MSYKLLIVEDNPEIFELIKDSLASLGKLIWASSVAEANKYINDNIDVLILDIGLPDGDGFELCSKLKASHPQIAIFIVSGRTTLSDKALGFSLGIEDYITKPFSALELKIRIEARIKKNESMASIPRNNLLEWREIRINILSREVEVIKGREFIFIELTNLEFKILMYLAEREGEVVSRDKILDEIWGKDIQIYQRSVDTHVAKLRRKLLDSKRIVRSIRGVGYKFQATEIPQGM